MSLSQLFDGFLSPDILTEMEAYFDPLKETLQDKISSLLSNDIFANNDLSDSFKSMIENSINNADLTNVDGFNNLIDDLIDQVALSTDTEASALQPFIDKLQILKEEAFNLSPEMKDL
jgi:hypothetical protein